MVIFEYSSEEQFAVVLKPTSLMDYAVRMVVESSAFGASLHQMRLTSGR